MRMMYFSSMFLSLRSPPPRQRELNSIRVQNSKGMERAEERHVGRGEEKKNKNASEFMPTLYISFIFNLF